MKLLTLILIVLNIFPSVIIIFNKSRLILGLPLIFFYIIVTSLIILVVLNIYFNKKGIK